MPRHNGGANETTLKGPSSEHYLVRHGEAIAKFSLVLVMAGAFGPYTPVSGVRTEQLAVYGCLLLSLPMAWTRIRITRDGGLFLLMWGTYIVVAVIGVFIPVSEVIPYHPGKLLGGADNLLRPVAVFLLANVWLVTDISKQRLVSLACKIITGAMCVNAAVAFIESRMDIARWLALFWSSPTGDLVSGTVAARSAQLGRFTGIVNQPVEAGTLYGIALLAALYLWHQQPWRLVPVLTLLTAGGAVTVSKIFLFVGVPIAAWQLVMRGSGRAKRLAIGAVSVACCLRSACCRACTVGWVGLPSAVGDTDWRLPILLLRWPIRLGLNPDTGRTARYLGLRLNGLRPAWPRRAL